MSSQCISGLLVELHRKFEEDFKFKKANENVTAYGQNLARMRAEALELGNSLKEDSSVETDQFRTALDNDKVLCIRDLGLDLDSSESDSSESESLNSAFGVNAQTPNNVKPVERQKLAKIMNDRGVVTRKCPIIKIDPVSPIPNMTTWAPIQRNFQIPDCDAKNATIHVPYFGEETFDEETDLLELIEKGSRQEQTAAEVADECDNYIFFNTALALMKKERMEESTPKGFPEHEGIQLPSDEIFLLMSNSFEGIGTPSQLLTKFIKMTLEQHAKVPVTKVPKATSNTNCNVDGSRHVKQRRNQTMDTFHRTFCRRCFTYNCQTHIESVEHVFPEYQKKKGPPLVQQGPCSESCYLAVTSNPSGRTPPENKATTLENKWSDGDANMYGALASVYPENYCAIGKILGKPCKLVQLHALLNKYAPKEFIPKEESDSTPGQDELKPSSTFPVVQKAGRKKGDPLKRLRPARPISPNSRYIPCFHPGTPCGDGNRECTCKQANTYCEKFCNCSESCKNRFQGCWCHATCSSGICPCFAAGRECDPDLCNNCGAGKRDGTTSCANVSIQKGLRRHLHLAKSDIPNAGWGVFTNYPIEKNEFIYEYAGELISYAEAERRGLAYDKRCHTYLFELNNHFMIDAMSKGNKMRFANHSDNPNCNVKITMVNGDHRIGIFAKRNISAGEELYIYYKNVLSVHQEEQEKRDSVRKRKRQKAK